MTNVAEQYQPGPVFYQVFTGALRVMGKSARSWADEINYSHQNLRSVATGHMNGPRAREVREMMVKEIGEEMFAYLYAKRMVREGTSKRGGNK